MKAADITDAELLEAVRAVRGKYGVPRWSTLWDVQRALPYPTKVVQAKLKSAVRRGLLTGCACGCRGDFEEPSCIDGASS
jgi:hypothetical protein